MSLFEVRINKEIRRSDLVFSALHLAGLDSSLERVIVLCFWARLITLAVPLSRQNYRWVLTSECLGGNLAIDVQPLTAVFTNLSRTSNFLGSR